MFTYAVTVSRYVGGIWELGFNWQITEQNHHFKCAWSSLTVFISLRLLQEYIDSGHRHILIKKNGNVPYLEIFFCSSLISFSLQVIFPNNSLGFFEILYFLIHLRRVIFFSLQQLMNALSDLVSRFFEPFNLFWWISVSRDALKNRDSTLIRLEFMDYLQAEKRAKLCYCL